MIVGILDDNYEMMDMAVLSSLCTEYYKNYFQLKCKVTFEGIGKIKLKDILEYPERYVLASMFDNCSTVTDVVGEHIKICRAGSKQPCWYAYNYLKIKNIINDVNIR